MKQVLLVVVFCSVRVTSFTQNQLQYQTFNQLYTDIINDKENITVLNFWATWCRPCVEELPDFEKTNAEFKSKQVKVILANLDFHSKVESLVPAFITSRSLQSSVVHITDQDPNDWINKVDETWTGAIPATVIYAKGKKVWFIEGQTNYEELKTIINKYISE